MATTATALMTAEEFLALPEDGADRWLIRGELREQPMTYRNRFHSSVLMQIGKMFGLWLDQQLGPKGQVLGGEAGVRLPGEEATIVGIDVVYVDAAVMAQQTDDSTIIVGVPAVAVEILSPSDTNESVREKIECYLAAGVGIVWVVDPYEKTVREYRPGREPVMFNLHHELVADPVMPGFRTPVKALFK